MSNRARVLVADDHRVFLEGLKLVINKTGSMTVTDEASDAVETMAKLRDNEYDLLVLDITMPGRNGLDLMGDIRALKPKLPVLILSMHPEDQYALRALKAGASGYLCKGSPLNELTHALERVAAGKKFVTPHQAEIMAKRLCSEDEGPLHERLSSREYQIMLMIAAGATPKKIAEQLMIGIKTVGTYRARVLQKMELKANAELTSYVIRHRLT